MMKTIQRGWLQALIVSTLCTLCLLIVLGVCIWIGNISPALIVLTLAWVSAGFFLSRKRGDVHTSPGSVN